VGGCEGGTMINEQKEKIAIIRGSDLASTENESEI